MRKSLRLALTRPTSLYKGGCFPQKDGRRVRVSPNKFIYTKEKAQRKNPCAFSGAEGETRRVFNPSCSLCEQFILCPFCSAKDGRRVRVSPNKFIYTKKKSTKEKSLCFFWRRRRDSTGFQPVVFALRTVYFMSLLLRKRWTKSSSLLPFLHYTEKRYRGKSRYLFWRRRRDSTGFQPVVFALRTVYFMSLLLRKRWTESSSLSKQIHIYKRKSTKEENPCAFSGAEGETRTLAPVTRPTPLAGAPRHQLEYFCIGSVYDTIRLLKERAENPLPLLSGGESGIRTHGTLPYDGFQDRSVITTSVSLRIRRKL